MATVPNAANNSMPGSCVCARVCLAPREVKESKESRRFKESKAALGQRFVTKTPNSTGDSAKMSRGCLAPPEVKEFKEFKVSRGSQGESRAVVFMVIDSHVIVHSPGPKHVTVVSKLRHLRHTYFGTTGASGVPGESGAPGISGRVGETGPSGMSGQIGPTG
ncbi:hypothetical protein CLAFUW4_04793 [Fulvia fulva]|uniref:Uncharacterized protein n=1 Tax=Passalora fulva TaxID=5499 RepID=A0A9Q8UUB2_PASFU|nr:uncharacterized protein CLAFUR5_12107 [Fulvia fulva]KAK4626268.1 hypothetical protein CLAFUR4_04779 [Fulvia fulva]KAK4627637.1 hypothetical protein CLAFUR0_04783 [Fulvia fulva]UJO22751.1 hypothetical protein CLAFUR5_12107 [Fulvia fulva]WPV14341.1 hypothetical protein CLAFUW4_04793 [Fulvia fulva]WPV29189.1 hypothetical protein CLAFUW7_04787 [Fulvia fulva]